MDNILSMMVFHKKEISPAKIGKRIFFLNSIWFHGQSMLLIYHPH